MQNTAYLQTCCHQERQCNLRWHSNLQLLFGALRALDTSDTKNIFVGEELDCEIFPWLLKPLLNLELRNLLKVCNNVKPTTTYQEWKEKALEMGAEQESDKRESKKHTGGGQNRNQPGKSKSKVIVLKEDKDCRVENGEWVTCGRIGHRGKKC